MRLLVCDDHGLLLVALTMALTDCGHSVVATASDPDEAVSAARKHQPDVCLLDMSCPCVDGFRSIARIRDVSPDTRVVVMRSGLISIGLVRDAIGQGAQGFVGKGNSIGVVIEALEQAHEGYLAVEPRVLRRVFGPTAPNDDPLGALMFFTEREWEVLRYIMDGLSNKQIAAVLAVPPRTAHAVVQNLLAKLGVH